MTYESWEKELVERLDILPKNEKEEIISYYREIYGDKLDAGESESKIVSTFGEPALCAAKILLESSIARKNAAPEVNEETKIEENSTPVSTKTSAKPKKRSAKSWAIAITGWLFFATLILIPFASAIISVIAALGASTFTLAALSVGGVILALGAPLGYLIGYTTPGVLATFGSGLVAAGVCAILTIPFYYLTKYITVSSYKLAKYCFRRDK